MVASRHRRLGNRAADHGRRPARAVGHSRRRRAQHPCHAQAHRVCGGLSLHARGDRTVVPRPRGEPPGHQRSSHGQGWDSAGGRAPEPSHRRRHERGRPASADARIRDGRQPVVQPRRAAGARDGRGRAPAGTRKAWRSHPVQFDRRGRLDAMEPRWQSDMYGSRNPAPVLAGTGGWLLFVAAPWVQVDLRSAERGVFLPVVPDGPSAPQTEGNQQQSLGKGLPPAGAFARGVFDVFVADARNPLAAMKDLAVITGPAALPPKWALGYMQSHRTLEDDRQLVGIVDAFRRKKIPLDAVIYLGTGFCPRGWNTTSRRSRSTLRCFGATRHRSSPRCTRATSRSRSTWSRGTGTGCRRCTERFPPRLGRDPRRVAHFELLAAACRARRGRRRCVLARRGRLVQPVRAAEAAPDVLRGAAAVDGRTRGRGTSSETGTPASPAGAGWVWSGDTDSSWKTLEAQVAVGLNYSLSIGPFWGSDIGGFYANSELTGELYARWFQFAAFCPSFRAHGRVWWMRLPWGWGGSELGPSSTATGTSPIPAGDPRNILPSELNNAAIEPVVRRYAELRYQLLPYTYTVAWEARSAGLPMMRAMWLHHPGDQHAAGAWHPVPVGARPPRRAGRHEGCRVARRLSAAGTLVRLVDERAGNRRSHGHARGGSRHDADLRSRRGDHPRRTPSASSRASTSKGRPTLRIYRGRMASSRSTTTMA